MYLGALTFWGLSPLCVDVLLPTGRILMQNSYYITNLYISKENIKQIESRYCKGVHEGCRVHFTDGVLRSECTNIAQIKYATRQRENNISKFRI